MNSLILITYVSTEVLFSLCNTDEHIPWFDILSIYAYKMEDHIDAIFEYQINNDIEKMYNNSEKNDVLIIIQYEKNR